MTTTNLSSYGVNMPSTLDNNVVKAEAMAATLINSDDEKLMNASKEFESYFLQLILKEMRKTVPTDGLVPKSTATEIFESMLDEEIAKSASSGQGVGLAQAIFEQMSRVNKPPVKSVE